VIDLGLWIAGALLTLIAFVSALKSATERATWRVLQFRKERRCRRELERYTAMTARGSSHISAV
jgi:hypothetical protein